MNVYKFYHYKQMFTLLIFLTFKFLTRFSSMLHSVTHSFPMHPFCFQGVENDALGTNGIVQRPVTWFKVQIEELVSKSNSTLDLNELNFSSPHCHKIFETYLKTQQVNFMEELTQAISFEILKGCLPHNWILFLVSTARKTESKRVSNNFLIYDALRKKRGKHPRRCATFRKLQALSCNLTDSSIPPWVFSNF